MITEAQQARLPSMRTVVAHAAPPPALTPELVQAWIRQSMSEVVAALRPLQAPAAQPAPQPQPAAQQALPPGLVQDDMASMWTLGQAVAQGIAGQNSATFVLAPGLSIQATQYPWTVVSAVHWLPNLTTIKAVGDAAAWRVAMNRARLSGEFFVVPKTEKNTTTPGATASIMKINMMEDQFEQLLKLYASAGLPLRDKDDFRPLFVAGASLLEAIITAKYGWPNGGAVVTKNFLTSWEQGLLDWPKLASVKFR